MRVSPKLLKVLTTGLLVGCSAANTDDGASSCSDPAGCGTSTGGFTATGGAPATGGAFATGGTTDVGTGGTTNTTCTDVRPTGTEWDEATCAQWASETDECNSAWMIDNHYCDESCGRCTSGGGDGSGGADGSGGTDGTGGSGTSPTTCNEANLEQCSTYKVGEHCGLTYEIWTDSTAGCMTNTANGFMATWTNAQGNYLARKGVRPGSTSPIVTYSADYNPNGNSYLAVYGWTKNPLVEYYIVESWGSWRPPGDQAEMLGTVTSDGGTYDVYRSERVNQPSIEGNKTFYQYWSVRQSKRTSGTITVAQHFDAWKAYGLSMGTFYEVSMVVEGYYSSGNANVTVSFQ